MPFRPGTSGNPLGRPVGIKSKRTLLVEQLFEGDALAVGKKALKMALAGNEVCIKLILDRVAPVPRGRRVRFALPQVSSTGDLVAVVNSILKAASVAEISIDEAAALADVVASGVRIIEVTELAERIALLEAKL